MPELPEVETVARQLDPLVRGREVRSVRILDDRLRSAPTPRMKGWTIDGVERFAKQVRFEFARGAQRRWLLVHLRMTGRLLWWDAAGRAARRANAATFATDGSDVGPDGEPYETEVVSVDRDPAHLRAVFELAGGRLLFVDTRRFGTFDWFDDAAAMTHPGVDPMTPAFTPERLRELLRGARTPLKPWLLRQDRVVGLGNIYASEILWDARLSPRRRAGGLSRREVERLHASTVEILTRAIENCGTTFSDFQDAQGLTGEYQRYLAVYARESEPCPRCGTAIRRVVQQQRSTFWCPECQRTGRAPGPRGRRARARV